MAELSPSPLLAQAVGSGQIQGTVSDSSGGVVAGAKVEALQTESGLRRVVVTGPDGGFSLPSLPVGSYQLSVTKQGFANYRQSGILIQVGNSLRIDVTLSIGAVSQTVQVEAQAPMVQKDDQSVSQVIDQQRVVDIPLNGRQPTDLILLTGATAPAPNGDNVTSKNYPSSVSLSVAGSQGTSTNYLMDGADNNDALTNVNLPFPFPDAVQEFSVQTSGLSAQYGLHPGAVVNIVTKSGTNRFHGTVFEFFRNGALNANNFFSTTRDSLKRNQFGGAIGGPIRKDKLFFFGGYQGTRTRQQSNNTTYYVPTEAMINGDWSQYEAAGCHSNGQALSLIDPTTGTPFANNFISPSRYNASAVALLKYLPRATNPCGKYIYGAPLPQNEDQYIGRLDWTVNDRQQLFGRYFVTHFTQPGFFNGNLLATAVNPVLNDQAQNFVLGHTWSISSNLVNSFRLGASRNTVNRGAPSDLINPNTVGINIASPVPNYIYLAVSGAFTSACGTCESYKIATNMINPVDDVFWTVGKHRLAFGVNYIWTHLNLQGTNNANSQLTFNGSYTKDALADFMLGDLYQIYQGNNTGSTWRRNYLAAYVQDTYQFSDKLTLNAGLRWESDLPEVETAGRGVSYSLAAFQAGTRSVVYPTAPAGLLFYGDHGIPHGYIEHHLDHFEPRVGFALDPRGKGLESIRGSYTLGFQAPQVYLEDRFENNAPWGDALTLTSPSGGLSNPYADYPGGNPFPQPFPPPANAFFPTQGQYFVFPTNLKPSYTQTWNLTFQKQFARTWETTVAYLGNHVLHIWAGNEQNPAVYIPGTWTGPGSCGALTVSPGMGQPCSSTKNTSSRRMLALLNPTRGAYFAGVSQEYDGASSSYNGLLLTLQHRFANYFTLLSNYTFSHCLTGATDAGDLGGNAFQNPANPNAEYSNCAEDLRHNFVTSIVARSSVGGSGLKKALLNGWQIAPIVSVRSGAAVTPVTGQDNSLTAVGQDRPNVIGDPYMHNSGSRTHWLNASSYQAPAAGTFGNARPNSVYGPKYVDMDGAIMKYIPIFSTMQLEARAECFNCLNHPNLSTPNVTLSNPSQFGIITSTGSYGPRILQLSTKIDF